MNEKIVFSISPQTGSYIKIESVPLLTSDQMLTLQEFLISDMQQFSSVAIKNLLECKNDQECTGFNLNVTSFLKISATKVSVIYTPIENIDELIISFEDMIHIAQEWDRLTKQKTPYITLVHQNNTYSIKGAETLDSIIKT